MMSEQSYATPHERSLLIWFWMVLRLEVIIIRHDDQTYMS